VFPDVDFSRHGASSLAGGQSDYAKGCVFSLSLVKERTYCISECCAGRDGVTSSRYENAQGSCTQGF
jgi:hypothetical protein